MRTSSHAPTATPERRRRRSPAHVHAHPHVSVILFFITATVNLRQFYVKLNHSYAYVAAGVRFHPAHIPATAHALRVGWMEWRECDLLVIRLEQITRRACAVCPLPLATAAAAQPQRSDWPGQPGVCRNITAREDFICLRAINICAPGCRANAEVGISQESRGCVCVLFKRSLCVAELSAVTAIVISRTRTRWKCT